MKQVKGDNRGLSLIEVLVAVVILALVITPFLHSFVTTANTNTKAKMIHRATVVAQSVMEGLKAEQLEDIALQFNYPGQGFYVVNTDQINGGSGVESLVEEVLYDSATATFSPVITYEDPSLAGLPDKKASVTASTYSEDMGATAEFLKKSSGIYYFTVEKMQEDIAEYDILVKLDATAYRAGVTSDVDDAHKYNSDKLAQLPIIDLEQDAMSVQKEDLADAAVNDFMITYSTLTDAQIRDNMKQQIVVDVNKNRVGTEDRIQVIVSYNYIYTDALGTPTKSNPKTQICYDSTETEKDLRSVYLYYYPLYSAGASKDEILFNNPGGVPVNFYLMKQQGSGATVGTETAYNPRIAFTEPGAVVGNMKSKVYTNMGTNVVDGNPIMTPFYTVFLNGSSVTLDEIASSGVMGSEETDRMFDIEVSVYQAGAKSAGFPADMHLVTLDGSDIK